MVKTMGLSAGGVLLWSALRHACLAIGMTFPAVVCLGAALVAVSWLVASQAKRHEKAANKQSGDGRAGPQEMSARRA